MDVRRLVLVLVLVLMSAGCDRIKALVDRGGDTDAGGDLEDRINREIKKETLFGPELRKNGCALLTPKMASDALGVPEGDLRQQKTVGCIYSKKDDKDTTAQASVMIIMTHKTTEAAKTWFKNATKDRTREELQAEMERVKAMARDGGKIDTQPKEMALDFIGEGLTPEGVSYEGVSGVGDEARIEKGNGSLSVRVRNLSFSVQGYKGKAFKATMPTKLGTSPQQIKEMMAKVSAEQRKFERETLTERREMAVKLAKLIVASLD